LALVDFDVVDFTSLQRQVTFGTADVGKLKTEAARARLTNLNPDVKITAYETRPASENALELFKEYDLIVDGTDNFPTRYLVNDACILLGKPNVYGSIFRFEGQITVFGMPGGPRYRCLYPEPPPPGLVPSSAEGGVLSVLPGIIGSLQAMETIKLLIGQGEPLVGRLLLFDALAPRFRELRLRKNLYCAMCGTREIHELIDDQEFCGIRGSEEPEMDLNVPEITAQELKERFDRRDELFILDVREAHEYQICNLKVI
jgi:sulfur-carrier protein adenylyltransferase/sulfurtransferase